MLLAPVDYCSPEEPDEERGEMQGMLGKDTVLDPRFLHFPFILLLHSLEALYHPLRLCGAKHRLERERMLLQVSSPLWPWLCHLPWP